MSATDGAGGPEYVVLLTQRCNFRCRYCYQARAPADLSEAVLGRLVERVRRERRPGTRVVFHGGEPLLRRDLLRRAVTGLAGPDGQPLCRFALVTNGALLDRATIALLARHGFRVDVSFDGCREAQALRDARSFERVVAALRRLVAHHAAGEIDLGVCLTVTLDNLPCLERSVAFLEELSVPRIEIEPDLFGSWVTGVEREVDRQVEAVVRRMERRAARGLNIPVTRLQPQPHDPAGRWWETSDERHARRERRLDAPECGLGCSSAAVLHPDGSLWACPMFVPGLGRVARGRLRDPDAFRLGSWAGPDGSPPRLDRRQRATLRREPILGPKRERASIFGACRDCEHAEGCTVCPAATHLPGDTKPAAEVPPLACRLNLAFLARRARLRRPPTLLDALASVAAGRPRRREARARSAAAAAPGPAARTSACGDFRQEQGSLHSSR